MQPSSEAALAALFRSIATELLVAAERLSNIAASGAAPLSPLVPGLTMGDLVFLGPRLCPQVPQSRQPDVIAGSPVLREVGNILALVAAEFGRSVQDMVGGGRTHARPRQHCMWLINEASERLGWSQNDIAQLFDMDHTTVRHGIKVVDRLRQTSEAISAWLDHVASQAYSAAHLNGD